MELKNFSTRFLPVDNYFLEFAGFYDRDDTLIALRLLEPSRMPALKVTVFIEDIEVPKHHILVKNWNENEGLFEALVHAKVIEPVCTHVPTGHTHALLCKLTQNTIDNLGV